MPGRPSVAEVCAWIDARPRLLFDDSRGAAREVAIVRSEAAVPRALWVIGDLHADILTLANVVQYAESLATPESPAHFVFLGDFVDRGVHDHETLLFLFGLAMAHPERVCVVPGNHDVDLRFDEAGKRFRVTIDPAEYCEALNSALERDATDDRERVALAARAFIRFCADRPKAVFLPDGTLLAHGGFPHTDVQKDIATAADLCRPRCLDDFLWARIAESARVKRPEPREPRARVRVGDVCPVLQARGRAPGRPGEAASSAGTTTFPTGGRNTPSTRTTSFPSSRSTRWAAPSTAIPRGATDAGTRCRWSPGTCRTICPKSCCSRSIRPKWTARLANTDPDGSTGAAGRFGGRTARARHAGRAGRGGRFVRLVLQCAMCGTHHPVGTPSCSICGAAGVTQMRLMLQCPTCGTLGLNPACTACPAGVPLELDDDLIVAEEVHDDVRRRRGFEEIDVCLDFEAEEELALELDDEDEAVVVDLTDEDDEEEEG